MLRHPRIGLLRITNDSIQRKIRRTRSEGSSRVEATRCAGSCRLSTHLNAEQAPISFSSRYATFSVPKFFIHHESHSHPASTRSAHAHGFQANHCG
jgi:hypothetical protein